MSSIAVRASGPRLLVVSMLNTERGTKSCPLVPIRRVGVGQALGSLQRWTWPIWEAGGIIILHRVVRPTRGYMLVAEIHGQAVRRQGVHAYDPGSLNLLLLPGPHPARHPETHPTLPTPWHSSLAALVGAGCYPQGAHVGLG